jgi:two-component system OmpR family response regulator
VNPPDARGLVLVVEDDRAIADLVGLYLRRDGFGVQVETDGAVALAAIRRLAPVAVVLDVGLPGMDGVEVCRRMRAEQDWTPVLFVTARDDEVDRIVGLELGADDYLPKPFNPRELLGRIRAVLRRAAHAPRDPSPQMVRSFTFGNWKLDTTTRSLTDADGKEVALSGAEYRLLAVLLSSANRVLSRAQLTELLRGREADPFDRSIDVRVSRLRQILGDDARAPQIIKTVYGEGYVVGVPVQTH